MSGCIFIIGAKILLIYLQKGYKKIADLPIYNAYKFIYILGVCGITSAICLTLYIIYYLEPALNTYYWLIGTEVVFGFDVLPLELITFFVKRIVRKSNLSLIIFSKNKGN